MTKSQIPQKWVKNMALDIATRTYFDSFDHDRNITPIFEYPEVEKAIIKWLRRMNIKQEVIK